MEKNVQIKKEAQKPSTILYREYAGKGFENVTQESLALPILKLLQNGIPRVGRIWYWFG